MTTEKTRLVHFTSCWLPQTMTWLYTHVTHLPEEFESHVVCQWIENANQFPMRHLDSVNMPPSKPSLFSRVQRRLGLHDPEAAARVLLDGTLSRLKPHILHSHFGNRGWENASIAQRHGVHHVVSFYGVDLSYLPKSDPRWRERYREMSDRVDAVLCEGPHMAKCLVDLGIDAAKVKIFRLGIDLGQIPFRPRRNLKGPKRFLIQGSFREKKGIPYALEALADLRRIEPDLQITIIGASGGSAREEEEKRKIFSVIERHQLGPQIRMMGYVPYAKVIEEFYAHDIFVSPSVVSSDGDTEGGAPVTIIEAAASGMPVMSTTHCDIPFVLSPENTEYLVPERDSSALSEAIARLLSCPDWSPIVSANRQLIERELDVRKQTRKLSALYSGLCSQLPLAQVIP